jgi:hypothetical protein
MIRPAEVSAGQILSFYDQQAALRQGIIGDRNGPAAKYVADNILEFGAAFGSGVDNLSRYVMSDVVCLTRRQNNERGDDFNCADRPHVYLRTILF